MKVLKNVEAFIDNDFIRVNIGIKDGKIFSISKSEIIGEEILVSGRVLPGFIDEHIHGAYGYDVMDATEDSLQNISEKIATEGVTSFLATTMTGSEENILNALENVATFMPKKPSGAKVLGVHLEGPFINAKKCGAQPKEYIVKPSLELFDKYLKSSKNSIKLVTIAPEIKGMDEFIEGLIERKVRVSVGHTVATYDEFKKAVLLGANSTTHTFNAMSSFNHREVGVVGGSILENVYNEIILDGVHVDFDAVKVLANQKYDKMILISDAMRAKYLPDGTSELGGQTVFVRNGTARLEDGTLAGSVLKLSDALKNAVNKVGLPLNAVIKMLTENPAKNIGLFDEVGSIAVGKSADFVIIDENLDVVATIVNGEKVFEKM